MSPRFRVILLGAGGAIVAIALSLVVFVVSETALVGDDQPLRPRAPLVTTSASPSPSPTARADDVGEASPSPTASVDDHGGRDGNSGSGSDGDSSGSGSGSDDNSGKGGGGDEPDD